MTFVCTLSECRYPVWIHDFVIRPYPETEGTINRSELLAQALVG